MGRHSRGLQAGIQFILLSWIPDDPPGGEDGLQMSVAIGARGVIHPHQRCSPNPIHPKQAENSGVSGLIPPLFLLAMSFFLRYSSHWTAFYWAGFSPKQSIKSVEIVQLLIGWLWHIPLN